MCYSTMYSYMIISTCNFVAQLPKVMINDDGIPEVTNNEKMYLELSSFPLTATMASINQ